MRRSSKEEEEGRLERGGKIRKGRRKMRKMRTKCLDTTSTFSMSVVLSSNTWK